MHQIMANAKTEIKVFFFYLFLFPFSNIYQFIIDCTLSEDFNHGRCKERPIETRCWREK